jgi:hypothetical protein
MRIDANNDLIHASPPAELAQAPIREDRTVMVRNRRQAPIKSLPARCRGSLIVDTSQERHVVTQGMGQAIKPQYHTHSQGSCLLLYFSIFLRWAG